MSQTRIFRNTGREMFAEDRATLDYIDPGIVLLYADTGKGLLCSYVEGNMGDPIQATVERKFDDAVDPASLKEAVTEDWGTRLTLSDAPADDYSNTRWALDGLNQEPLAVSEHHLRSIRGLLSDDIDEDDIEFDRDWGEQVRSHLGLADGPQTDRLDVAVGNPRDGARLFKTLVEELSDIEFTVALSKSGRIDELADTNIVIHINSDALDVDERIAGIEGTTKLLNAYSVSAGRERIREAIAPHLAIVEGVIFDAIGEQNRISTVDASRVLREELNDTLLSETSFRVVETERESVVRRSLAVTGLLVGLVTGILTADQIETTADQVITWGGSAEATVVRWVGTLPLPDPTAVPGTVTPFAGLAVVSRWYWCWRPWGPAIGPPDRGLRSTSPNRARGPTSCDSCCGSPRSSRWSVLRFRPQSYGLDFDPDGSTLPGRYHTSGNLRANGHNVHN
jgi:hypothetical protein